jgi:hypothetical protein
MVYHHLERLPRNAAYRSADRSNILNDHNGTENPQPAEHTAAEIAKPIDLIKQNAAGLRPQQSNFRRDDPIPKLSYRLQRKMVIEPNCIIMVQRGGGKEINAPV